MSGYAVADAATVSADAVPACSLPGPAFDHPAQSLRPVTRTRDGERQSSLECVAEEVPVAMVYNGISHAVMLATPADLEDFGLGFSLSEGIVRRRAEVLDIEVAGHEAGIEVRLQVSNRAFEALKLRRRTLAGRTGCGLCGVDSLAQVAREVAAVSARPQVSDAAIHRAFASLSDAQPLHRLTGSVHAAGWAATDGTLLWVREDVGRHNALDKLIGALLRSGRRPQDGFALVTSRASFEMAQKAAMAGIPLLAAISAPTALAVRLAQSAGLTLVGFARGQRHNVYAHPQRLG